MKKKFALISVILGFLSLSISCSDSGTRPDEIEFVLPDSNLHYVEHIQDMFIAKCGFESGCHSAPDIDANGLTYGELTNSNALINHTIINGEKLVNLSIHEKNPHLSPLYLILVEGYPQQYYDQMPPPKLNRTPLNENQLNGVLQWIREGAQE